MVFPVMFLNEKLLLIVTLVSNLPLIIVGLGAILLLVFILLLVRSHRQRKNPAKGDASYTAVSCKEKEEPQNGTDMHMMPLAGDQ
ncbi:hypothetical protein CRUP_001108 [Coryphaenoides rupestris]|nr:hypothetical protein CRUP_001108 [Coryphaenoides rupestris]